IFEQLGEGLSVYDAQGLLVRTNAAQRRLLGLDAAPHRYFQTPMRERMDLYRLRDRFGHPVAPEDWPVTRALRGEVVTGADALYLRLRSLDGRELEVLSSAAPLRDRDGHIVGAVGVVRDQTEQNLMQRDREAVQAREWAARELALQLDQFFTMAAHDIRSPLTSVLGGVQLAQRRIEQLKAGLEPDGKQADLVSRVVSSLAAAQVSVDRLIRLAELLFDVAKARSGRLEVHLAPCDLAAVVREQVQAQRVSAPHRDIRLEMPDQAVPVLGEADRLGQVLTNYMTNALKYSTDDQPVDVRLEVWERQVVVSVRDMGPGLALAEQARVWELFHRAPGVEVLSGAGGASSLGLGLYICKRLIELHGGRVGVESTVGQGSTFWFRLPLASEGDPAVDETPQ
ncbi:MAG TPA: PAS domain-containing sensor histidine kinase, partial [Ktedonobacterales bacterium]